MKQVCIIVFFFISIQSITAQSVSGIIKDSSGNPVPNVTPTDQVRKVLLTYLFHQKLNVTTNYSQVTDLFTLLSDTTLISKTFITKINLASQDIVSLNINIRFNIRITVFLSILILIIRTIFQILEREE